MESTVRQFLKRFDKTVAVLILILGLLTPLLIFANRVAIPDLSADSLNYHLYLGFKGFYQTNNKYEFYPTGIHNFASIFDIPGFIFFKLFGYRLGTIFSVVFIYLAILGIYKIFKLLYPQIKITSSAILSFLLVSSWLSFELFLGIASYYNDGVSATIGVWAIYFIVKYLKDEGQLGLMWSMILLSIMLWGKQTNMFLVIGAMVFLVAIIFIRKKNIIIKLRRFVGASLIVSLLPALWYLKNYMITGNPIFPFYNAYFKSKYFASWSFAEEQFGGRNLWERLWWGIYSIFNPPRLGQVHDLFNDYKINFYFVVAVTLIIVFIIKKKQKYLEMKFVLLFLILFECWSLIFGYIRYGLVLEFLGGLAVMILFVELKGKIKWLVFIPIFLFLILQNKRVINLSLAYDIAFRPGYYYNRLNYSKEIGKLAINKLDIKNEYKADVYLNCAFGGMTYYVVSPYNNLPVLNVVKTAYSPMTNDPDYIRESWNKLKLYLGDKQQIKFVTINAKTGMNSEYGSCINNLAERGFMIENEKEMSFLGYEPQGLVVTYGYFEGEYFDKISK